MKALIGACLVLLLVVPCAFAQEQMPIKVQLIISRMETLVAQMDTLQQKIELIKFRHLQLNQELKSEGYEIKDVKGKMMVVPIESKREVKDENFSVPVGGPTPE